jgi:hypothetical protein
VKKKKKSSWINKRKGNNRFLQISFKNPLLIIGAIGLSILHGVTSNTILHNPNEIYYTLIPISILLIIIKKNEIISFILEKESFLLKLFNILVAIIGVNFLFSLILFLIFIQIPLHMICILNKDTSKKIFFAYKIDKVNFKSIYYYDNKKQLHQFWGRNEMMYKINHNKINQNDYYLIFRTYKSICGTHVIDTWGIEPKNGFNNFLWGEYGGQGTWSE